MYLYHTGTWYCTVPYTYVVVGAPLFLPMHASRFEVRIIVIVIASPSSFSSSLIIISRLFDCERWFGIGVGTTNCMLLSLDTRYEYKRGTTALLYFLKKHLSSTPQNRSNPHALLTIQYEFAPYYFPRLEQTSSGSSSISLSGHCT